MKNLVNFTSQMISAANYVSTARCSSPVVESFVATPWEGKEPSIKVMSQQDLNRCWNLYVAFLTEKRLSKRVSWRPSRPNYRAYELAEETFTKSLIPMIAAEHPEGISFGEAKCLFKGYSSKFAREANRQKGLNKAFCYRLSDILSDNKSVRELLDYIRKSRGTLVVSYTL